MTGDEIFKKYWDGLLAVSGDVTEVSDACVALALRLAIADGVTVGRSIEALEAVTLRQRIERKESMLLDLQAALDQATDEAAGLRQQVMQLDADAAGLLRQVRELEAWKTAASAAATSTPIAASTDSGAPAAGATLPAWAPSPPMAAAPAPDDPGSASSVSTNGHAAPRVALAVRPRWWNSLDPETEDWRISLEAGRRKFRDCQRCSGCCSCRRFCGGWRRTMTGKRRRWPITTPPARNGCRWPVG